MWLKILNKKRCQLAPQKYGFFKMINACKKFKNSKFKQMSRRDPSCGHLLEILRSKLFVTFKSLLVCVLQIEE